MFLTVRKSLASFFSRGFFRMARKFGQTNSAFVWKPGVFADSFGVLLPVAGLFRDNKTTAILRTKDAGR